MMNGFWWRAFWLLALAIVLAVTAALAFQKGVNM